MFKKPKVAVILSCSFLIALASFSGCASKKKVEEAKKPVVEKKEERKAPEPIVKNEDKQITEDVAKVPESAFNTVYFDFDKSDIRSDQRSNLNRNARLLNDNKNVIIRLEGHCDERGTNEYNQALGERRANAIRQFLTDYGITSSRITTISYGEERPASSGHNESAWSKNRRCEFSITNQ